MNDSLKLIDFLSLPDKVINNSKNNSYVSLLTDEAIDEYYYTNIRKDMAKKINKFNDIRYTIDNGDILINSSSNYKEIINNNKTDKVSNYVSKKIEKEKYALETYNSIINLSLKLTYQEAVYFVNCFFGKKTDEYITELLGVSKNQFLKIRKSCLVKLRMSL